jgi:hypothetical protein
MLEFVAVADAVDFAETDPKIGAGSKKRTRMNITAREDEIFKLKESQSFFPMGPLIRRR